MHELPVMKSILDVVIKHANMNNVKNVVKIYLKVGVLCDLEEQWMQRYFGFVSENTVAEGAVLEIERVPVTILCDECAVTFEPDFEKDEKIVCIACASEKCTLIEGNKYFIGNMEAI